MNIGLFSYRNSRVGEFLTKDSSANGGLGKNPHMLYIQVTTVFNCFIQVSRDTAPRSCDIQKLFNGQKTLRAFQISSKCSSKENRIPRVFSSTIFLRTRVVQVLQTKFEINF